MQLFVRTLTGKTITLSPVSPQTSIQEIKQLISEKELIPVQSQRLVHQARQLDDPKTLSHYAINNDSTIHLVLSLMAGTNLKKQQVSNNNALLQQQQGNNINNNNNKRVVKQEPPGRLLPPSFNQMVLPPQPQLFFNQAFLQQQQQQQQQFKQQVPAQVGKQSPTIPSTPQQSVKKNQSQSPMNIDCSADDNCGNHNHDHHNHDMKQEKSIKQEYDDDASSGSGQSPLEPSKKKPKRSKRGQYTKRACVNCRFAHAACDEQRPCKRCVALGKEDSCQDAERKRTRKRTLGDMENKFYNSMQDFLPLIANIPNAAAAASGNGADGQGNDMMMMNFSQYRDSHDVDEDDDEEEEEDYEQHQQHQVEELASGSIANSAAMQQHLQQQLLLHQLQLQQQQLQLHQQNQLAAADQQDVDSGKKLILALDQNNSVHHNNRNNDAMDHNDPNSTALILFDHNAEEDQHRSLLDDEEDHSTALSLGNGAGSSGSRSLQQLQHFHGNSNGTMLMESGIGAAAMMQSFGSSNSNNDQLLQQLMIAYAKQAQELKELKELVRHLQDMIISSNMPNASLVSAAHHLPNNAH